MDTRDSGAFRSMRVRDRAWDDRPMDEIVHRAATNAAELSGQSRP